MKNSGVFLSMCLLICLNRAFGEPRMAEDSSGQDNSAVVSVEPASFDVISIRMSNPEEQGFGYNPDPNHFTSKGADLRFLVQLAYGVNSEDVIGIKSPMEHLRFDIQAKADVDPA